MRSYNIVGIDYSLTSPGVACLKVNEDLTYELVAFDNCTTDSKEEWFVRLDRVQSMVSRFVFKHKPKQLSIENYSYGSTNGRETAGEVHGISIFKLIEQGFPAEHIHRDISPQARAKFFTGNGRAKKGEVTRAVNAFFGTNFKVTKENDIADACVLAYIRYCINHYAQIEHTLTKEQKEVLKKIMEKNIKPFGGN